MTFRVLTPDPKADLRDAELWARRGPGWLANAREQGRTDDVGRIQGNIAWATNYLTSRGATGGANPPSPAPAGAARPTPVAAGPTVPPTSPHSTERPHQPAKALQTDASAQPTPAAIDVAWDQVVTGLNAEKRLKPGLT